MENNLETTTAKAIAGRFRNNGISQPQMYIDTLMITRILFEWSLTDGLVLLILRIEVQDTHEHIDTGPPFLYGDSDTPPHLVAF